MDRTEIDKRRSELRLQRRIGINVKLDFDSPQWWTADYMSYIETLADRREITAAKKQVKAGKVIELNVLPGSVEAKVQDTRKAPYHVRLYSRLPSAEQIDAIKAKIFERAMYGALLLAGEIPHEMAKIFEECGTGLVPRDLSAGRSLCSCPDPGSMCIHILAATLAVIDAFDRDPFLLLRMRGIDKDDLLSSLTEPRGRRARHSRAAQEEELDLPDEVEGAEQGEAAATRDDTSYYGGADLLRAIGGSRPATPTAEAGLPVLDFPLWRGELSFYDSMKPYYDLVKRRRGE